MARIIATGPDTFQYVDDEEATPQEMASNYRTGPVEVGIHRDPIPHGTPLYTSGRTYGGGRPVEGYNTRAPAGSDYDFDFHETGDAAPSRGGGGGGRGGGQPARSGSGQDAWAVSEPTQRGAGVRSAGRPGVPPRLGPSELRYSRGGQPVTLDTDDPRAYEKKWKSTGAAPDYQGRPYARGYTEGAGQGQYGEPQVLGSALVDPGYSIYGAQGREPKVQDVGLESRVQYSAPGRREPQVMRSMYVPSYSEDPGYSVYDTSERGDPGYSVYGTQRKEPEVQSSDRDYSPHAPSYGPNWEQPKTLTITSQQQMEDIQSGLDLVEVIKQGWGGTNNPNIRRASVLPMGEFQWPSEALRRQGPELVEPEGYKTWDEVWR